MQPKIENINKRIFIGKNIRMCLSNNKTVELWKSFMPKRKEIQNNLNFNLYSLQIYSLDYFDNYDPNKEFEKWALIEVSDFSFIPNGMKSYTLEGGLYAVFGYRGLNSDTKIFDYIFREWIPNSEYLVDNRPHFEIMGEKYKNNDPNSEEEIWVPIKKKN